MVLRTGITRTLIPIQTKKEVSGHHQWKLSLKARQETNRRHLLQRDLEERLQVITDFFVCFVCERDNSHYPLMYTSNDYIEIN